MEMLLSLSLLRRVNLNYLVTFMAVAESGSFRGAAIRLHVSQSALSAQIRQLEETLGVPLFHRTTRSVTLTEEGTRLLPVARLVAHEVTLVAGAFREEAALRQGIATLSATPSITSFFVAHVLQALAEAYPGIKIHLLVKESSNAVADAVRQGDADVGLLNFNEDLKELTITKLLEDKLVAIVPASAQRWARSKQLTLRQLAEFPFVTAPCGTSTREVLDTLLLEQRVTASIRYEVLQPDVAIALVKQGLGVTVLPSSALSPLNLQGCKVIGLRSGSSRAVGLATSTRRSVSPSAALLRKFIVDASREIRPMNRVVNMRSEVVSGIST